MPWTSSGRRAATARPRPVTAEKTSGRPTARPSPRWRRPARPPSRSPRRASANPVAAETRPQSVAKARRRRPPSPAARVRWISVARRTISLGVAAGASAKLVGSTTARRRGSEKRATMAPAGVTLIWASVPCRARPAARSATLSPAGGGAGRAASSTSASTASTVPVSARTTSRRPIVRPSQRWRVRVISRRSDPVTCRSGSERRGRVRSHRDRRLPARAAGRSPRVRRRCSRRRCRPGAAGRRRSARRPPRR